MPISGEWTEKLSRKGHPVRHRCFQKLLHSRNDSAVETVRLEIHIQKIWPVTEGHQRPYPDPHLLSGLSLTEHPRGFRPGGRHNKLPEQSIGLREISHFPVECLYKRRIDLLQKRKDLIPYAVASVYRISIGAVLTIPYIHRSDIAFDLLPCEPYHRTAQERSHIPRGIHRRGLMEAGSSLTRQT